MRILYITKLWLGLEDLIVRGQTEAGGMPSFLRPFEGLVAAGHQVDCIVATDPGTELGRIEADWLRRTEFTISPWIPGGLKGWLSVRRLRAAVAAALTRARYDFVYGHGAVGAPGLSAAWRAGIACGQRLYGVHGLNKRLDRMPRQALALRSPLLYQTFRAAKSFLLITDDGSQGDRAWQRLGRPDAFDFHFWRNGVDFGAQTHDGEPIDPGTKFLFMPARIAAWKRQHHALEMLRELHAKGHDDIHLYVAGGITEADYWDRFQRLRDTYGLGSFVRYLGNLPAPELVPYYKSSVAVLAPYQVASMGNVVIEALAAGGVVAAQESEVLDGVIKDGENGLRIRSPEDAANRLADLLSRPQQIDAMKSHAARSAREIFLPWEERVAREIGLIEKAVEDRRA
ncbi:MAG: glycosyltransferase family 4 protein [Geminicoccaceae bacterium]